MYSFLDSRFFSLTFLSRMKDFALSELKWNVLKPLDSEIREKQILVNRGVGIYNFMFYSFLDSGLPADEFGGTLEFAKIRHN